MSVSSFIYHDEKFPDKGFPVFELNGVKYVPYKLMKRLFPEISNISPVRHISTITDFIKDNREKLSIFYPNSVDNDYASLGAVSIYDLYRVIDQDWADSIKTFIQKRSSVPKKRKYKKPNIEDEFIEAVQKQVRDEYEQGPEFTLFEKQIVEKYQKEFQETRDTELEAAKREIEALTVKYKLEILEKGKQVDELEAKAKRIKLIV